MAYLTQKEIRETKTGGRKKYTVTELRRLVRQQVKEANRILIETEGSKKAPYLKKIIDQISQYNLSSNKTGEYLTQSKVKYMTSRELMSAYNALEGLKQADMSSLQFARKQANRRERMRRKWKKTAGLDRFTQKEFDAMMFLFEKYGNKVKQYGYSEILDKVKEYNGDAKKLINKIIETEEKFPELGPNGVLKYIENEGAAIKLIEEGEAQSIEEAFRILGTQK